MAKDTLVDGLSLGLIIDEMGDAIAAIREDHSTGDYEENLEIKNLNALSNSCAEIKRMIEVEEDFAEEIENLTEEKITYKEFLRRLVDRAITEEEEKDLRGLRHAKAALYERGGRDSEHFSYVTVADLPVTTQVGEFLYCLRCGSETSGTQGDYFYLPKDHKFECGICSLPLRLVTRRTQVKVLK